MVLRGGITAQIEVAVNRNLASAGIGSDGPRKALAERAVQRIANSDVGVGEIQQLLPGGDPVIQHAAQGDSGNEYQRQRKLVVFPDVAKPLQERHPGKSFPVFRPLGVCQLHSSLSSPA